MNADQACGALRVLTYIVALLCGFCLPSVHAGQVAPAAEPAAEPAAKLEAEPKAEPRLLVFISLSMPAAQLRELASEARRLQAVLLLRSFPDASSSSGESAYQALFADSDSTNVQVDPFLFHDYAVAMVPAYVLPLQVPSKTNAKTNAKTQGWHSGNCGQQFQVCPPQRPIAKVAGAASIGEALRYMSRKQQAKAAATALLEQLGAKL